MSGNALKCPACGTSVVTYRNPFPTVDIIIRQGDSIVLIERKNEPRGWALPGGFVDYGESLEDAAMREAKEETGLDLFNLRQFGAYSDPGRDPRQHNISVVFTARGEGTLQGGDDAARAKLFPLDDLPSPLCFDHARILQDYRDRHGAFHETHRKRPKALAFVARSGTGKTTLLEGVIGELTKRGYHVGALKHDAHRFEIDHPGKDSYRMTAAGAQTMVITSSDRLAAVKRLTKAPPLNTVIDDFFSETDIVLVEGFAKSALPRIEIDRSDCGPPPNRKGRGDTPLVAVATDRLLDLDVPLLDLNDHKGVCDFIEERFLR